MRFTAGIPAYPALFRTRNGRQTCHIGFTDGKQTDSVRTRTRNGRGKCDVRFATERQVHSRNQSKTRNGCPQYHIRVTTANFVSKPMHKKINRHIFLFL